MEIDLIQQNEELTSTNLNRPLSQLLSLVNSLQTQVSQISAGATLVSRNVPYDTTAGIALGNLVYTGADGLLRKAKAVWRANADYNGAILPDDSAYVTGLVTSLNSGDGTATVVTRGRVENGVSLYNTNLFGTGITSYVGTWMLSDTTPGRVMRETDGTPYLKIPVITVDSSGAIVLTGAVPYAGYHIHKAFTIPSNASWTASSGIYTYSGSAISDLAYFNWTDATILVDGIEDYQGNYQLEQVGGSTVVRSSVDPSGHVVQIFIAVPDSHSEPVVRGIRIIGTGRANASSLNGLVTIGFDGWDGEEPPAGYRDRAVSRLTENGGYEMTKVVSSIVTDSTMSATEGANGEWALSSAQGPFYKPVTISLDNTTVTSSNNIIYYVFPYSRVSAILGVINIPTPPTGYHWSAVPFVQTAKSTVSVTASLMFLRTRTPGTSTSIPSSPVSPSGISISSSASSSSSVTTLAAEGWSISYEGTAWLRLASDGSSASDMMILSFGLQLTAVQN